MNSFIMLDDEVTEQLDFIAFYCYPTYLCPLTTKEWTVSNIPFNELANNW